MAEHYASVYGTEKDKINCSFYVKTGACRHGERCSRVHNRPVFSQTILLPNLYQTPHQFRAAVLAQGFVGPEIPDEDVKHHFDDFYYDIAEEMSKYGPIEGIYVCENDAEHLCGNTYVKFANVEAARSALMAVQGRWYAGRQVYPEFSPVSDFREGKCRPFERNGICEHGGYCHFMHLRKPPSAVLASPCSPPSYPALAKRPIGPVVGPVPHDHAAIIDAPLVQSPSSPGVPMDDPPRALVREREQDESEERKASRDLKRKREGGRHRDRDRDRDLHRERDKSRRSDRPNDYDWDRDKLRDRERERERHWDRDRERDRDRGRYRERGRDRDRERLYLKDRDYDRDRDRDREQDRYRGRERDRERTRERDRGHVRKDRDRNKDRERERNASRDLGMSPDSRGA